MKSVEDIITGIIQREGSEYTNRPSDRGGATKYGVTLATLARWRHSTPTPADVEELKEDEARQIYRTLYVQEPRFDLILQLSQPIGIEVVDTGVNMGQSTSATFLQRCLNVFNGRGVYYADIKVDGQCGGVTAGALGSFLKRRGSEGESVMVKSLNCLQGARYVGLAENREADEDNVYGWLKERA